MNQQTLEQSIEIVKSFSVRALQAGLFKSFQDADLLRTAIVNIENHLKAKAQEAKGG